MLLEPFIDKYYANLLQDNSYEVVRAKKYLSIDRGLKQETIDDLKIGFCLRTDDIPEHLNEDGYNINRVLLGKIVVPIRDEFGKVVAVSCRGVGKGQSWWNQSFAKNSTLFMLDKARKHIFKKNMAIMVEGQMDTIISHQEGVRNCVGMLGTVVSVRRVSILLRYCDSFCICFDSDDNMAGQNAQQEAVYNLHTWGIENIFQMELPKKVDPDEFILAHGAKAFTSLIHRMNDTQIEYACKAHKARRKIK